MSARLATIAQRTAALLRAPARRWLPRRTVRMRLTALYGGLFLVAGALLLTITYLLVASHIGSGVSVTAHVAGKVQVAHGGPEAIRTAGKPTGTGGNAPHLGGKVVLRTSPANAQVWFARSGNLSAAVLPPLPTGLSPAAREYMQTQRNRLAVAVASAVDVQRSNDLSQLLLWSGTALAIMSLASVLLGWLMAGRVLAPLRTMTGATQRISADNLDQRLTLDGPDDELKDLGDTINGLLARLEQAFDAQRRFVANASHELRTPLTLQRAMIEVALADPDADVASLRTACERVIAAGEEQERLIEALLTLARSQRGLQRHQPVDLCETVANVLADVARIGAHPDVQIATQLDDAHANGDPRLVARLAANLLDNAVRHNVPGGWVSVATRATADDAVLRVANSGPQIPPSNVADLLEPFRRAAPERAAQRAGQGLGLSIAVAIAQAHGARMIVRARPEGGLDVQVHFPAPAAGRDAPSAEPAAPAADPPATPAQLVELASRSTSQPETAAATAADWRRE